jgi:hypothetical protein
MVADEFAVASILDEHDDDVYESLLLGGGHLGSAYEYRLPFLPGESQFSRCYQPLATASGVSWRGAAPVLLPGQSIGTEGG